MTAQAELWQAVHTAYEEHNPDEARRLLHTGVTAADCSLVLRCGDEDYIRWLLSNEVITPPSATEVWPELQELQLQCSALAEESRPSCILNGDL